MPKRKFLIGGFIVFLAIVYLGYIGFGSSATYYLTVGELKEQESSIYDKNIKVNGRVAPGSVDWNSKNLALKFILADDGKSLPVIYQGVVPDAFKAGSDVVVEGRLNTEGVFRASTILTKCPSRYVPAE